MENKTNNKEENNDTVLVPGTAGNISALPHTAPESGNRMYTLHDHLDDEDRDEGDDDEDSDDEETHKTDWGDVDPQHNPMAPRSPMDPAAPGSAV